MKNESDVNILFLANHTKLTLINFNFSVTHYQFVLYSFKTHKIKLIMIDRRVNNNITLYRSKWVIKHVIEKWNTSFSGRKPAFQFVFWFRLRPVYFAAVSSVCARVGPFIIRRRRTFVVVGLHECVSAFIIGKFLSDSSATSFTKGEKNVRNVRSYKASNVLQNSSVSTCILKQVFFT